jgi:hypothetical protein
MKGYAIIFLCLLGLSCSVYKYSSKEVVAPFIQTIDDSLALNGRVYSHIVYRLSEDLIIDGYWNFSNDTLLFVPQKRKLGCISRPMIFMVVNETATLGDDPCRYNTSLSGIILNLGLTLYDYDSIQNLHKVTHRLLDRGCYEGEKADPILRENEFWIDSSGMIQGFRYRSKCKCYFGYESE